MFLGYKWKSDLDKHMLRLRQCWESQNDLWRFLSSKPVNRNIGRISLNEARGVPHITTSWSTSTGCSCTRLTGTSMACNVLDGEARTGARVAPWMNWNGRLWRSFDSNNLLAHTINVCCIMLHKYYSTYNYCSENLRSIWTFCQLRMTHRLNSPGKSLYSKSALVSAWSSTCQRCMEIWGCMEMYHHWIIVIE